MCMAMHCVGSSSSSRNCCRSQHSVYRYRHTYNVHVVRHVAHCRVVNTASIGESWGLLTPYTLSMPYNDIPGHQLRDSGERPYVLSKTMVLMAGTREMAKRLEGTGVDVFASK